MSNPFSEAFGQLRNPYLQEELPPRKNKGKAPAGSSPAPAAASADQGGGSEKKIKQAVYDIRYRARREDVELDKAFSQYMSNTNMSAMEKKAVRGKLFGESKIYNDNPFRQAFAELRAPILGEEIKDGKEKVRVTDKSGKSYVRYADQTKKSELRQNPNVQSVNPTDHGIPYEGEKKKGEHTAKVKAGKKLDPVGKSDADIDNDGDVDKSDKYLHNRRKAIGKAIRGKMKEDLDVPSEEITEIMGNTSNNPKVTPKKGIKNTVKINPDLGESVIKLEDVDVVDLSDFQEKMTGAEMDKKEDIVKGMKKNFADMKSRYGSRAKEVMYATATKMAMKDHWDPEHVEPLAEKKEEEKKEKSCAMDKEITPDMDSREVGTRMNLKRNKLRAMGLKMGFDPSEEVDEALHPNVARNDAINKANAMKRAKEREASKPSPDVIAARKRQYSGKGYTTADKKKVIGSYKEHHEKDADGKVIEHPIEDEKKPVDATPSSVNEIALAAAGTALKGAAMKAAASKTVQKTAKKVGQAAVVGAGNKIASKLNPSPVNEEGYDHARDMGRVKPSKDKKDGTSYPPSKEMMKTRKVNKGPSALERVKAKYGKSVMKMKEEVELLDEKVGGSGTLVRQGVKVGGKKGGRIAQKAQDKAVKAGQGAKAKASQGNKNKMVGDGKYEKRGALAGGIAAGTTLGLLDGPLPAGEIVGGIAGAKLGGKIGRQFDKKALKKKMKEEVEYLSETTANLGGLSKKNKEAMKGESKKAPPKKPLKDTKNPIQNAWNKFVPPPESSNNPNVRSGKNVPNKAAKKGLDYMNKTAEKANTKVKEISKAIKTAPLKAGVAGAAALGGLALASRLAKKSKDKDDKKESFSNWRDELSREHEDLNEVLGAALGGATGIAAAGTELGKQQLTKIGLKKALAQKAAAGAAGAAAGEVLDPTKKGKDKKPLTAALAGGLGGAVAGGGIGAATDALDKGIKNAKSKMKKEEVEAVDENAGPSTPVSMSGGKLQFNKGGAGIGKIRPKKGGSLAGAPIPRV